MLDSVKLDFSFGARDGVPACFSLSLSFSCPRGGTVVGTVVGIVVAVEEPPDDESAPALALSSTLSKIGMGSDVDLRYLVSLLLPAPVPDDDDDDDDDDDAKSASEFETEETAEANGVFAAT